MIDPMIPWMLMTIWMAPGMPCLPITGGPILARDMARAAPVFAGLPPELVLGYAPAPGARRYFDAPELSRLARRYGLTLDPGFETCFVRPVEALSRERVERALHAALPDASIDLVDFSRQPVPSGELRFAPSGLQADSGAGGPLLWRGAIRVRGRDDFPVWAKARIEVSGTRVTAREALPPGHAIRGAQLREEPYQGPPGLPNLSQIVGLAPRRPIPAGAVIERQWLGAPDDVTRGEPVLVEIRSGRALLMLEGEAQSSGRRGDTIPVRNPGTGKILRVIVTEPGRGKLDAPAAESGDR